MKANRGGWKTCSRGHKYRGTGPCPVCSPGRKERPSTAKQTIKKMEKEYSVKATESLLRRPRNSMTAAIRNTLNQAGLMAAFRFRPAYQQNDYIGWITRAKRTETKAKRLQQMLHELKVGGVYMKMKHRPSERS